ncbi:MAG TPA: ABC transporter permease [Ktedonosporobacter sp.]|nr:ABC transporter permease [Ktedonosporobacter sp.]
MFLFLLKRLIGLVFVLICVTFITFIMGYLAPGDPIRGLLGPHFNPITYVQLKHVYGLDLPWYQQYFNFLAHLMRFDFGLSFEVQGRAVWDILKDGVPTSLELGFWGLLIQLLIGIPMGVVSALRAGSWIDTTNMSIALVLYAIPSFVFGVLLQVVIVWLHLNAGFQWPVSGWGTPWHYSWSDIQFKLIPILVYAAIGIAFFARLTRTSTLEILRQDYIRTARAKGLIENIVIYRHALRNAMIPIITALGVSIGFLVVGAFFIENVFNISGIGYITIASVQTRDYPVIQATTVLLACAVVMGNLISDILYTVVDPRIKAA